MLDVKELFTTDRWRQLHGSLLATAPNGLTRGPLWPEARASEHLPRGLLKAEDRPQKLWLRFPDPAAQALWQSHASRAEELLEACGACLQNCHRDAVSSRQLLRACRSQLEAHQASSAAVRELLGDEVTSGSGTDNKENRWAAEAVLANGASPTCAAKPAHCIGRSRCFFCRERRALEEELGEPRAAGDPWELDSAILADGSNCCESMTETPKVTDAQPVLPQKAQESEEEEAAHEGFSKQRVQRRRTYRERERRVFKARVEVHAQKPKPADNTWFAKHTVDPADDDLPGSARGDGASSRSPVERSRSPVMPLSARSQGPLSSRSQASQNAVFGRQLSQGSDSRRQVDSQLRGKPRSFLPAVDREINQSADAAELEPYTSAAARFRAEMEFLDMLSFPASPGAVSHKWPGRTESGEGSAVVGAFVWSQEAKVNRASSKEQASSLPVPSPPPPPPPPPPTDTLPLSSNDFAVQETAPKEARTTEAAARHLASQAAELYWKHLLSRLIHRSGLEQVLMLSSIRGWAKLLREKHRSAAKAAAFGAVFQPSPPPKRTGSKTGSLATSTAGSPTLSGAAAKAKAKEGLPKPGSLHL